MLDKIFILFLPIVIFISIFFCQKFSILNSFSGDVHQKFVEKKSVPMLGGIFSLIVFIFYFKPDNTILIFLCMMFGLGIMADVKILKSPLLRFSIQSALVIFFIFYNQISIEDVRVDLINNLLQYEYFNYFFVFLSLMVIVNGSNFIDGLNTLLIGYYLIISYFILNLDLIDKDIFIFEKFNYWILFLLIIFLFNIFKKIFMGDGGAYLIGFIYGFLLIDIYSNKPDISPFFILMLLWYPCFEILFSVVRKLNFNRSPIKPDTKHFHQMIYYFLQKKLKIQEKYLNSFTANLINLFNFLIILVAAQDITNTQYQIILIIFSIFVYIFIYARLLIYRYKK
jgi:UDP-N-acetylmuramyl pentapeptide phosphotransferase/UDP-N-acetylglucosamine-1-phosphate transferase